jgi:hypothetical protein
MAYESNGELRHTIQRLDKEVAVLQTRVEEKDKALKLQALEYERRLEYLNQSHERAEKILGTYATRETLDRIQSETEQWRRTVDLKLASNEGAKAMLASVVSGLIAIAAFVASILNYIFGKQ